MDVLHEMSCNSYSYEMPWQVKKLENEIMNKVLNKTQYFKEKYVVMYGYVSDLSISIALFRTL